MSSRAGATHFQVPQYLAQSLLQSHTAFSGVQRDLPRMAGEQSRSLLLALPDPCLLAVLQHCAADSQRSLFSAARAHPRLHKAAVLALRSIQADELKQHQVDSMLLYLEKHGQHVDSVHLGAQGWDVALKQLPANLPLSSLQLEDMRMELCVLGAAAGVAALTQLRLAECKLVGCDTAGLAATLPQLIFGLQHLSIDGLYVDAERMQFPTSILQQQHQQQLLLTHLELAGMRLQGLGEASPALQPLQALTGLVDLRLHDVLVRDKRITANLLSGMQRLTRLDLAGGVAGERRDGEAGDMMLEAGVLAGKTGLQHLQLVQCKVLGGPEGIAQLLSHLQPLQQLTHLELEASLKEIVPGAVARLPGNRPAAAYAALTASSKLQHLGISACILPAGVWQQVLPAGRQLPHLTSLDAFFVRAPSGCEGSAPEGNRLVSCCPGLQDLNILGLETSREQVTAMQGLSGLQILRLSAETDAQILSAVCQLTGLQQLEMLLLEMSDAQLLQLTQLQQLTQLSLSGCGDIQAQWESRGSSDEPVWRRVARFYLNRGDPDVVQRAAAALAE